MIKECCIRTASLVTLIPSMNNDEDFQVCREKHLQRFQLNKVVFYATAASPVGTMVPIFTNYRVQNYQSKRIIFHFAEKQVREQAPNRKFFSLGPAFQSYPQFLAEVRKWTCPFLKHKNN